MNKIKKIFVINSNNEWFYIENKLFETPEVTWGNSDRETRLNYPPSQNFPIYIILFENFKLYQSYRIEDIEDYLNEKYLKNFGRPPTMEELNNIPYLKVSSIIRKDKLEKINESYIDK